MVVLTLPGWSRFAMLHGVAWVFTASAVPGAAAECKAAGCDGQDLSVLLQAASRVNQSLIAQRPNYAYFCNDDPDKQSYYRACEQCVTTPVCCDVNRAARSNERADVRCTQKAHGITNDENCAHLEYPSVCPPRYQYFCHRGKDSKQFMDDWAHYSDCDVCVSEPICCRTEATWAGTPHGFMCSTDWGDQVVDASLCADRPFPTACQGPTRPTRGAPSTCEGLEVSPCESIHPQPQYDHQLFKLITCPVLGALFRNGDLVPDENDRIHRDQTFRALLSVGISCKTASAATSGNFDHQRVGALAGAGINIFEMNLKVPHVIDPSFNLEHDFSTGIRDHGPDTFRFQAFEQAGMLDTDAFWTPKEVDRSIIFFKNVHNSFDLGPENSPGTLMSISAMLQEFGNTSSRYGAFLSKEDMRNLFLNSVYTPAFRERLRQRRQQAGC